ncbi:MAG: hypothetical protein ATN31_06395 [Candidatus Epulonipiscioides saccharophilum]|nr:MAG: hypothetical protein ATN31_06395 [Epulopiscium sp. AS2M-Bin001]
MQINIISPNFKSLEKQLTLTFPDIIVILGDLQLESADIVFGLPKLDKLSELKHLKFVQLQSAGYDFLLRKENLGHIRFASASGAYNDSISEHMLTMNLNLFRHFNLHRDYQNKSIWQKWSQIKPVKLIKGCTVLIVGLGQIGGAYAKLIKQMGAHVIGLRRSNLAKPEYVDELYLSDKLESILPLADVVAISTPLDESTKHLFNQNMIDKMKDGSILINIGRGSIVDTEALADALESGKLSGAALDVTDPEPLPKEHRLWKIESAIITPHCAGGSGKTGIREATERIFLANVSKFLNGEKLINEVNLSVS